MVVFEQLIYFLHKHHSQGKPILKVCFQLHTVNINHMGVKLVDQLHLLFRKLLLKHVKQLSGVPM